HRKIKTLKTTQPLFASLHASFPNRRGVEELRILQIRKITSSTLTKKFGVLGQQKGIGATGAANSGRISICCFVLSSQ
ncbi:MAG: hypothetical protein L6Q55_15605, partial [Azonexus sp.]